MTAFPEGRGHQLSVNGTLFNLTDPDAPGSAETLAAGGVVVASDAVGGSAMHTLTQMANGLVLQPVPAAGRMPENK